ncbi:MAG: UvrB/UvrC motif-containing protein [Veillonellaceae bacterium]|nr:UvrB/UvrC motif-containing protein [Veillonellaceae bacterium]
MRCEQCGEREANMHFTVVQNGKKTERHLCSACAAKQEGGAGTFDLWDNDFFKSLVNPYLYRETEVPHCETCGLTLDEFNENGRFGCPQCYTSFREQIMQMLPRLQGRTRHVGKVPLRGTGVFTTERQLQRLQQMLADALQKEEYERAAELRDEIHSLQRTDDTGGI